VAASAAEFEEGGVMPKEIWRAIKGYEGHYEVSNLGKVRSLDRTLLTETGKRRYKGKELKLWFNKFWGYYVARLVVLQDFKPKLVHRLVAEAFIGPPPSKRHVTNHRNLIKTDNRAENLEWVTHQENILHASHGGVWKQRNRDNSTRLSGSRNPKAKLSETQVREIKAALALERISVKDLAARYKTSIFMIYNIRAGVTWKDVA